MLRDGQGVLPQRFAERGKGGQIGQDLVFESQDLGEIVHHRGGFVPEPPFLIRQRRRSPHTQVIGFPHEGAEFVARGPTDVFHEPVQAGQDGRRVFFLAELVVGHDQKRKVPGSTRPVQILRVSRIVGLGGDQGLHRLSVFPEAVVGDSDLRAGVVGIEIEVETRMSQVSGGFGTTQREPVLGSLQACPPRDDGDWQSSSATGSSWSRSAMRKACSRNGSLSEGSVRR